ncbi:winged helix-turn-helix transcriptional regulator [Candidatus Woesearchaeota archaeon]|nr:winged helix-turn-helix transcriptional regulator [Candidatus Woesearchaeota archaeon]
MLKKEMIIENFRVKSSQYWVIKTKKAIIISHLKYKYLNILVEDCQHTKELAEKLGVSWKSAFRRLKELEKLGLVIRTDKKMWKLNLNKNVIAI